MKVIGVEIRFGVRGPSFGETQYEAKLLPVELAYPDLLALDPCRPYLDGTIHTSRGDVGFKVELPMEWVADNNRFPDYQKLQDAMREFRRRVEAL